MRHRRCSYARPGIPGVTGRPQTRSVSSDSQHRASCNHTVWKRLLRRRQMAPGTTLTTSTHWRNRRTLHTSSTRLMAPVNTGPCFPLPIERWSYTGFTPPGDRRHDSRVSRRLLMRLRPTQDCLAAAPPPGRCPKARVAGLFRVRNTPGGVNSAVFPGAVKVRHG